MDLDVRSRVLKRLDAINDVIVVFLQEHDEDNDDDEVIHAFFAQVAADIFQVEQDFPEIEHDAYLKELIQEIRSIGGW